MHSRRLIAGELAATLLAGTWAARPLEARAAAYLGKSTKRWQKRLIADIVSANAAGYPPSPAALADRLLQSAYFDRAAAIVLR